MRKEKETFRTFVGSYPEFIEGYQAIEEYLNIVKGCWPVKISCVKPENMHITWKFLGDITLSRINRTIEELTTCKESLKPVELLFDQVVMWPGPSRPRQLVWLGTDLQNNIVENIQCMEKAFKKSGFRQEKRPFKPHMTLGRFRLKDKPETPLHFPETLKLKPIQFKVKKLCIIQSDLKPQGPVYTVVNEILLNH
jgi:2'-5' RNA ligase